MSLSLFSENVLYVWTEARGWLMGWVRDATKFIRGLRNSVLTVVQERMFAIITLQMVKVTGSIDPSDPEYFDRIDTYVADCTNEVISIASPPDCVFKIAGLKDTRYSDLHLEEWQSLYTVGWVRMTVLGVVDGLLPDNESLVVLAGADGRMYAYDGRVLHQVSPSLISIIYSGLEYPGYCKYHRRGAIE
ncbi:putative US22-like protein [Namao virus]|nr:putative US22-like protein [Namao virus]